MMPQSQWDREPVTPRGRGFVTIATGDPKYYRMAQNLLRSYRVNGASQLPFALICDRVCEETREFDHVVIVEEPHHSYLDKLSLYRYAPYEETVFLDADSLILGPMDVIFDDFSPMGDFCCYGKVLPLDSPKGWFFYEGMGELKERLTFSINMHGGIYYLRKTEVCRQIFEDAVRYAENYHSYAFAQFRDPADEPVLALSMALAGCKPCDRRDRILFLPSVDGMLRLDKNGDLRLRGARCDTPVIHFANINIKRYLYKSLALSVNCRLEGGSLDPATRRRLRVSCLWPETKALVRRTLKKILPAKAADVLRRLIKK